MRIAVLSDIHGNLTALEAVMADLRTVGPDLVVHGGDLVAGGPRSADVIDCIRDLKWPGVLGNTDEMLWRPERLADLARKAPGLQALCDMLGTIASTTAAAIGDERLQWLQRLPRSWSGHDITVVHATRDDLWRTPLTDAPDEELLRTYGDLGSPRVVYGHIHRSYIRHLPTLIVANSGSVSLSYDGDPRAAYVVIDDDRVTVRRVEYDVEREVATLFELRYPNAEWHAAILRAGAYVPPG